MLINVMIPGGLEPGGIGARSARKVRLMHALVRQHVRSMQEPAWSPSLGEPINQEDLAGTLLTFSLVVLDGLRKIGADLSPLAERGYFAVWCHIGTILGIDPRLMPRDFAAGVSLAEQIGRRQFRASIEGRHLARELVKVNDALFPIPGYGLSLMHFFLDGSVFGVNLAELLELPLPNWTRLLVHARAAQKRIVLGWLKRVPGAERRRRVFAGFFTQRLILLQRPDKHSPFEVPAGLWETWRLGRRGAPSPPGRVPSRRHGRDAGAT
jgi:ER-bound oxygenase mpaB/B'/Rubber oxygenase, catalytic domain